MAKTGTGSISRNDKEFLLKALGQNLRLDGRSPFDFRPITFQFSVDDTSATVNLGDTCVMTVITAALETPRRDRPNEGSIRFNVDFSPMAAPTFEAGRQCDAAIEVQRVIERGLRDSKAIDQEALCVLAGRKAWSLKVDVQVLDHGGNVLDAAALSALAALMAFRRPQVEVGESGVVVHPPTVREPLPLSLHHLPLATTFAMFSQDGELIALDPSLKEEAASYGSLSVIVTPHDELCGLHQGSGVGLSTSQIMRCVRIAASKVSGVVEQLHAALAAHEVARVQSRVRRYQQDTVGLTAGSGVVKVEEGRTTMTSTDVTGLPVSLAQLQLQAAPLVPQESDGHVPLQPQEMAVEAQLHRAEQGPGVEEGSVERSSRDQAAARVQLEGDSAVGTSTGAAVGRTRNTSIAPRPSAPVSVQSNATTQSRQARQAKRPSDVTSLAAFIADVPQGDVQQPPDLSQAIKAHKAKKSKQKQRA